MMYKNEGAPFFIRLEEKDGLKKYIIENNIGREVASYIEKVKAENELKKLNAKVKNNLKINFV